MKKMKLYMILLTILILTGCACSAHCDAYGDNTHPQNLERNDS